MHDDWAGVGELWLWLVMLEYKCGRGAGLLRLRGCSASSSGSGSDTGVEVKGGGHLCRGWREGEGADEEGVEGDVVYLEVVVGTLVVEAEDGVGTVYIGGFAEAVLMSGHLKGVEEEGEFARVFARSGGVKHMEVVVVLGEDAVVTVEVWIGDRGGRSGGGGVWQGK